jgi:hypothetical protein
MHGLTVVSPIDVWISGIGNLGHGVGADVRVFKIGDVAVSEIQIRARAVP